MSDLIDPDIGPSHPLLFFSHRFDFLTQNIDVVIMASPLHFGVMVSLTNMPPPLIPTPENVLLEQIAAEVANSFAHLAADYVRISLEHQLPLVFPDDEAVGHAFTSAYVTMQGSISENHENAEEFRGRSLSGEYLFVSEAGTEVEEFFIKKGQGFNPRILH